MAGVVERTERAEMSLLLFFLLFGFWHPAAYQANLCQDDSRI